MNALALVARIPSIRLNDIAAMWIDSLSFFLAVFSFSAFVLHFCGMAWRETGPGCHV